MAYLRRFYPECGDDGIGFNRSTCALLIEEEGRRVSPVFAGWFGGLVVEDEEILVWF